jgi:hypothetical protein
VRDASPRWDGRQLPQVRQSQVAIRWRNLPQVHEAPQPRASNARLSGISPEISMKELVQSGYGLRKRPYFRCRHEIFTNPF